jgi:hypothetical protein
VGEPRERMIVAVFGRFLGDCWGIEGLVEIRKELKACCGYWKVDEEIGRLMGGLEDWRGIESWPRCSFA